MYMRYLYLMMILYKESKKLCTNLEKYCFFESFEQFWTVLDSFGQLRGFGQDGLNLSKRGGFYHFVQNLPTLHLYNIKCLKYSH